MPKLPHNDKFKAEVVSELPNMLSLQEQRPRVPAFLICETLSSFARAPSTIHNPPVTTRVLSLSAPLDRCGKLQKYADQIKIADKSA